MVYPAIGIPNPAWPLPGVDATVDGFGSSRGPNKLHPAIDLHAPEGTLVVATEPGVVVNIVRGWDNVYKKGELVEGNTARMLVQGDSGLVVNYAAIGIDSWDEMGLREGDRVVKGQAIARVGRYPSGAQMLHFETYRSGTRDNLKWFKDQPPPDELLDPTNYLERAQAGGDYVEMDPIDVVVPRPVPPPTPPQPRPSNGAGVGPLLLVALVAWAVSD